MMCVNLGAILEPCDVRTRITTSNTEESYLVSQNIFQIEVRR